MTVLESGFTSARQIAEKLSWRGRLPGHFSAPRRLNRRIIVGIVLATFDFAGALLAAALVSAVHQFFFPGPTRVGIEPWWLAVQAVPLAMLYLGLGESYGPTPVERLRLRTIGLFWITTLAVGIAAFGSLPLATVGLLPAWGVCTLLLGFYGELVAQKLLLGWGVWGVPMALAGRSEASGRLAQTLLAHPEYGLRPVGFVEFAPRGGPDADADAVQVISLGANSGRLPREIEVLLFPSVQELVACPTVAKGEIPCSRVVAAYDGHDVENLWLQTQRLRGPLGIEMRRSLYLRRNLCLKRLMDLAIAVPAAMIAGPVILVLAAAVKLVDPGPAFFRQKRIGQNGREIALLKLRTMYVDAEQRLRDYLAHDDAARAQWERYYKLENDPRVLPRVGDFLRRSSLDELPQLFNILRGEMSVVGPRPFPSYHMAAFPEDFRALRISVPPGLTGLWQISSRSDGDLRIQQSQDTCYIRNWSIWLDLYILLQTVPAVGFARGAR